MTWGKAKRPVWQEWVEADVGTALWVLKGPLLSRDRKRSGFPVWPVRLRNTHVEGCRTSSCPNSISGACHPHPHPDPQSS